MMSKLKRWLNKKAASVVLAFVNVEKNAFSQRGEALDNDVTQVRRHTQGQLADSLINGELTQEVMNLRWRTYKVLQAAEGYTTEIIGYDENDMPITRTRKFDKKAGLVNVKTEPTNQNELELVVDNTPITVSVLDAMDATLELNNSVDFFAKIKNEVPIKITRETTPKFEIEKYTTKLHVRKINDTDRLLELYVSSYPDEYNRTSRLFISEVKKTIEKPRQSALIDIKALEFVTYKTIGADDFLEYKYEIKSFDKIVEFNGNYVIKFIAKITIDGDDLMEKHRVSELDTKYKNKEKKVKI